MNNTPETDAEGYGDGRHPYVATDFARKLERERDEAITRRMETIMQCELYEQERDEAREALKHIEEYGTEEINAAVELRQKLAQALVDLDNMQDQRDLAMKVIKRLEQERDEAMEDLKFRRGFYKVQEQYLNTATRERDEAMRQLGNIKASSIHSCHDQCQRPMCVLRRERDEARVELAALKQAIVKSRSSTTGWIDCGGIGEGTK
jgi:seryl-tRNA synthetase